MSHRAIRLPRVQATQGRRHYNAHQKTQAKLNHFIGCLPKKQVARVANDFIRLATGQEPTTEAGKVFIQLGTMSPGEISLYPIALANRLSSLPGMQQTEAKLRRFALEMVEPLGLDQLDRPLLLTEQPGKRFLVNKPPPDPGKTLGLKRLKPGDFT